MFGWTAGGNMDLPVLLLYISLFQFYNFSPTPTVLSQIIISFWPNLWATLFTTVPTMSPTSTTFTLYCSTLVSWFCLSVSINAVLGNLWTHKGTNAQTEMEKQAINPLTFRFPHNSVFIFRPLLQTIDHTVRFIFTDTPISETLVKGIINFSWYWYYYRACLMIRVFVNTAIETILLFGGKKR